MGFLVPGCAATVKRRGDIPANRCGAPTALTAVRVAPSILRAMVAPQALLEIEQEGSPSRSCALGPTALRIGRAKESDVYVPEGHISKMHAEIRFESGSYHVIDVGSRAGVLVNGNKVDRHALADGDVIELGPESPVRMTFRAPVALGLAEEAKIVTHLPQDASKSGLARLARFFEFSRKLGGGFSLDEVLRDVVDLAIEVTGAERGMLILARADDSLEMREARAVGGLTLPKEGVKVSETLVRKSITLGKPCVIADLTEESDLAQQASIVSLELLSAVTLPIVRSSSEAGAPGGVVIGVLYLDSRRRRGGFDQFDMNILERLAQDASSVIENARLLREAEDKRRMDQEVEMAREVQAALMPEKFQSTPTFEVAGVCVPCNELGGDYVDQFDLGWGRQAVVVADVAGKGIAASLLAAALQGALAAEIGQDRPLGEIVERVNRVHCRLAQVGKFVTMVAAVLEADGTLAFVNAGHCLPLHVQREGVACPALSGMALGLDADATYEAGEIRMQKGDAVAFYTDGIIECEGPERELFGQARLERVLSELRGATASQLVAGVQKAVEEFRRGTPVSDDLSVLVVRRV
jgi:serine phosphatase RsbU (regulator of sigma subunit)/pSer/pThr/pTyr-binding forkhead associated (FHA) protein